MKRHSVLVPTDFSKASKIAVGLGKCLAEQYGFDLSLLHIFPYVVHHQYIAPVGWMVSELRDDAQRDFAHLKTSLSPVGCNVRSSLVDCTGDIAKQIIERAVSEDAAAIVMGAHSKDGIERFVVGSVTEAVLRSTNRPVITVGPTVKSYAGRKIRRLVYATDLTERSLAPLHMLSVLMEQPVKLTVIYVAQTDRDRGDGWESIARSALITALTQEKLGERVEFKLLHGKDPAEELASYLKQAGADLLLIGMHRGSRVATHVPPRTGFRMIMAAPCAVLSVCGEEDAS